MRAMLKASFIVGIGLSAAPVMASAQTFVIQLQSIECDKAINAGGDSLYFLAGMRLPNHSVDVGREPGDLPSPRYISVNDQDQKIITQQNYTFDDMSLMGDTPDQSLDHNQARDVVVVMMAKGGGTKKSADQTVRGLFLLAPHRSSRPTGYETDGSLG
jgi:hypothetical protein